MRLGSRAPKKNCRSPAVLASGPHIARTASCPAIPVAIPRMGRRSSVGLIPATPQKCAGTRMLPPMSVPIPSGDMPEAMAAPSPPDEPPGVCFVLQGFALWPKTGLRLSAKRPSCDRFVRPMMIAPASRRTVTIAASRVARTAARPTTPKVVASPAMSRFSFTETGRPWSGPRRGSLSARSASASARSRKTWVKAFSARSCCSMRSRCAATTSREESSLRAISRHSSAADRSQGERLGSGIAADSAIGASWSDSGAGASGESPTASGHPKLGGRPSSAFR